MYFKGVSSVIKTIIPQIKEALKLHFNRLLIRSVNFLYIFNGLQVYL